MSTSFSNYWQNKIDALDVHYHARPDSFKRRYNVIEAGKIFSKNSMGCVLKNHLGSTTSLASLAQEFDLPVFGSIVLNSISGGINITSIKQALCQYSFYQNGRLIVHLPTVVKTNHSSVMNRKFSNTSVEKYSQEVNRITTSNGTLKSEISALIAFSQENDIVISTGHASKREIYSLLEFIDKYGGGCRLMLNQPANPITGMSAKELIALGKHDWLFIEQTALTVLLKYQSFDDFTLAVKKIPNLVYSSDLGQLCQIDIEDWIKQTNYWFDTMGVSKERYKEISLFSPLRMLSP
ncbi:MAG: DUF6282 family protein [Endozoicomonas sp. (ex Botrylloides leachii)]|nr:DUF6282 family protein [Endozoicomonas sp. (ex Botrylloides leachii)]